MNNLELVAAGVTILIVFACVFVACSAAAFVFGRWCANLLGLL